jgi:hypothetical protein
MKKLFTVVFTMLLAGSLAFAQATGGTTDAGKTKTAEPGKKATKSKKGKKGSKKGKKASAAPASTAPAK